jgi:galactokinase
LFAKGSLTLIPTLNIYFGMQDIRVSFQQCFNRDATLVVQSPGRINLIGEHTDYNHGFVLPAAIDKCVEVAVAKRTDGTIHMHALDLNELVILKAIALQPHPTTWVNYIIGVVVQAQKYLASASHELNNGFDICLQGNIPIGAGLSSSAAVECAVLFALNEMYALRLTKMQMALMTQQSEHEFAGVKCGIMDMYASLHGKKDQVMLLDCANLESSYYPLVLQGYQIVLFDTQIKHELASTEYNTRRLECEKGIQLIQQKYPAVKTFRDVSATQVAECLQNNASLEGTKVYERCKYVVDEIQRVQLAVKDLLAGDIAAFGQKMFATHQGLSELYDVSCPELDILVNAVTGNPHVVGARMMGGGFGGCTINIIKETEVDHIINTVSTLYNQKTKRQLKVYPVQIEQGTHIK